MLINQFSPYSNRQDALQAQGEVHDQRVAQDSLRRLILYYLAEIGSARTPDEAKAISQKLQDLIGKAGGGVATQGVSTPAFALKPAAGGTTAAKPAAAAAAGGTAVDTGGTEPDGKYATKDSKGSNEAGKHIIYELHMELDVSRKGGNKEEWAERAKTDDRIKIFTADGKDKSATGQLDQGDILVVTSAKHGVVRIMVGGDGEINGSDDKVLSVGGQAAAQSVQTGLNKINNVAPTADEHANHNHAEHAAATAAPAAAPAADKAPSNVAYAKPVAGATATNTGVLFNDGQLRSLLAALMQMILNAR